MKSGARNPMVIVVVLLVAVAFGIQQPAESSASPSPASREVDVGAEPTPLVFFRTANRAGTRLLRRVLRVNPRTGRSLPSITPPADFRSFVDAVQVGGTSFLAWTSRRGGLWLGAAGPNGRIARRWQVGRSGGFEVLPVPLYKAAGTGTGFVRVSADQSTALLVNGRGRGIGRFVDLESGTVRERQLPVGLDRNIADAAAIGGLFVLSGYTGAVVSMGSNGDVVARTQVKLAAKGAMTIGFVKMVALSGDRAVFSFINGRMYRDGTRRFIGRYNARNGALTITRSYPDFEGYEFAATQSRFAVFGNDHWTIGPIDRGPLRRITPPGAGPRPPAFAGIEPEVEGVPRVFGNAIGAHGRTSVFRAIDYENIHGMAGYVAYEVVQVDVESARVIRRTRFGDETGGPSPLPFAFDVRVS